MKNLKFIATAWLVLFSILGTNAQVRKDKQSTEPQVSVRAKSKEKLTVKDFENNEFSNSSIYMGKRKNREWDFRDDDNENFRKRRSSRNRDFDDDDEVRHRRYRSNTKVVVVPQNRSRVKVLPLGFVKIYVGSRPYYYHEGIYYEKVYGYDGYEIIDAPRDAVVYTLPGDTQEIFIDGRRYFESCGVLYKIVTTPNGKAFQVVERYSVPNNYRRIPQRNVWRSSLD